MRTYDQSSLLIPIIICEITFYQSTDKLRGGKTFDMCRWSVNSTGVQHSKTMAKSWNTTSCHYFIRNYSAN